MTDTLSSHLRFKRKTSGCGIANRNLGGADRYDGGHHSLLRADRIASSGAAKRGQRTYDHEDVRRLSFIRRCREFDFPNRRHSLAVVIAAPWQILHRGAKAGGEPLGRTAPSTGRTAAGIDHRLAGDGLRQHMRRRGCARLCNPAGAWKRSAASRGDRDADLRRECDQEGSGTRAAAAPKTSSNVCRSAMSTSARLVRCPRSTSEVTP
jgi:hypothetical protein